MGREILCRVGQGRKINLCESEKVRIFLLEI